MCVNTFSIDMCIAAFYSQVNNPILNSYLYIYLPSEVGLSGKAPSIPVSGGAAVFPANNPLFSSRDAQGVSA
jgi:hypothetical protein